MKLAYLVWRYPEISHTFLYREIAALRAAGVHLTVFAQEQGRPAPAPLADPGPVSPLPRGARALSLGRALVWALLTRPGVLLALAKQGVGKMRLKSFLRGVWLGAELRRGGFDALHAPFLSEAAELGLVATAVADLPLSVTVHGRGLSCPRPLAAEVLAAAAAVHVVCADQQLALKATFGRWAPVLRCGVRGQERAPRPDGARLLTVARCVEKKGLGLALLTAEALKARGLRFEWCIVGDGPLLQELAACVERRGLQGQIKLLGPMAELQIQQIYAAGVSVFVFSGLIARDGDRDGIPVAMLDAMARAVPVVATSVAGVPEALAGSAGLLVPLPVGEGPIPLEPPLVAMAAGRQVAPQWAPVVEGLAEAIEALLGDAAGAAALGARGQARVAQAFDERHGAALLMDALAGQVRERP